MTFFSSECIANSDKSLQNSLNSSMFSSIEANVIVLGNNILFCVVKQLKHHQDSETDL